MVTLGPFMCTVMLGGPAVMFVTPLMDMFEPPLYAKCILVAVWSIPLTGWLRWGMEEHGLVDWVIETSES